MRSAAVLLLTAALAACAQTRPYERPPAPVPQVWPEPASGTRQADAIGWREFFTDPRLRSLVAAALEHNRDLRIALARVEEARAAAGLARAERVPAIEGQASGSRSRVPGDRSFGFATRARNVSRYDVGLGITAYELDFWGRVARLDEAARAQLMAAEHARRAFHIGLVAAVADTWLGTLELAEREALAAHSLAAREATRTLVARRREAGVSSELDVLAAEAAASAARVQAAELARQRTAAENALQLLTGMETVATPGRPLAAQDLLADFAPGLPSEVLLRRPDVMAAEERLVAAHASVAAARAAFFPRVVLTASLGTASAALSGLFGAGSHAWAFQPVLRAPLFDGGRTQANIDLAEARKDTAVAEYERAIQQAFREVADALASRTHLARELAAQQANAASQRERLAKVEARQRAGIANYLEVLDARREAFAADQTLVALRRQHLSAGIALYKALGGGVSK